MPRKNLIKTAEFPYNIVSRTNNKEWFQVPISECWDIFGYYLNEISKRFGIKIGSFVLMSNHIHMIVWTPNENLDQAMHYLFREISKTINKKSSRINHLFGGPYKWSLIMSEKCLSQAYRYNYQNALVKGMVEKAEDYKYSTLYNLSKNLESIFPVYDELIIESCEYIPKKLDQRLVWLNEPFTEIQREAIQHGTKRNIFKLPTYKKFKDAF